MLILHLCQNTFHVPYSSAYFYVLHLLSEPAFHAIQSLRLKRCHPELGDVMAYVDGHAPYNKWCWLFTLREVARMPNLKRLKIDMVISAQWMSAEYQDFLFADWNEATYRQHWLMERLWPPW
jgi:hypothetical protein